MDNHCQFWKKYDSVSGSVSFCELAAFNRSVNPAFLAEIGCTPEQRKECPGGMELNIGTGDVPVPVAAPPPVACDPPPVIAQSAVALAQKKAAIQSPSLQLLAILAGAYIALGAILCTIVTNDLAAFVGDGLSRLVGGMTFSLGLVLVVMGGAELFTGNNLMVAGFLEKKISLKDVLNNWGWVYVFNFVGSLIVVALFFYSGIWKANGAAVGVKAINTAVAKTSLPWQEAFFRGIFCNWLVCLAVWLSMAGKDAFGKIIGIMIPITAFVAAGFEHSIANMYFIPMGILLKNQAIFQSLIAAEVTQNLNWGTFLWNNLVPVTLGNIVGGVFFVAVIYWNAYLRPAARPAVSATSMKNFKN